ncbi:MAG: hypothetical protein HUU28_05425 [Planctomycetaceae bacterium]|nr:hypothetical protein [Planctomycetaceae bacterium]
MPASVKLQEQYGDDVQVIFIECQNTDKNTYEAFAWKMKWMGNGALWTNERVIPTTGSGLPEVAVIGVDGTVLLQGHPGDFGKKLEETVAAEVKKSKEAPEGTPASLKKAWSTFAKGDVTGALAEADKVGGDEGSAARAEFVRRVEARLARAKRMLEAGDVAETEALVASLQKSCKGAPDLLAQVSELATRIASPELAAEREAAKAWSNFSSKVAKEKPFDEGNVKKAQAIADKHKGTKNGARAARFVELSKINLNR